MQIECIVAVSENHVIGINNTLPWRLPADLKHFKNITMGHPIVMGRRTFESLPAGPLPGRLNVVLSHSNYAVPEGVLLCNSIEQVFLALKDQAKICVIGGASLFQAFMPYAHILHLTRIHQRFDGDTYFDLAQMGAWECIDKQKHEPNEKNVYSYTFITYANAAPRAWNM